jgi:proline dehydrogenase
MELLNSLVARSLPLVPRPLVWRIARRYVDGLEVEDAVRAIRGLAERDLRATVDILGEHIHTADEARQARDGYLEAIDRISLEGLPSGVSVKPTQMGLQIDPELAYGNISSIAAAAGAAGRFLRIDMEDSGTTEATIALYRRLRESHPRLGLVLQAYLRRTLDDVRALLPLAPDVRLCKGIYREPAEIAFQGYEEVRRNFLEALRLLLAGGARVGIATHDPYLIQEGLRLCEELDRDGSRHEFQMLYGVGEQHWGRILGLGHRLRIYVPYGQHWYAYSLRRLRENSTIAGHVLRNLLSFRRRSGQ